MSCDTPAVVADHISKTYWLYPNNYKRCLGCFIPPARLGGVTAFHALTDLSFTLCPGEALALIGKNGAGKSTALQILTGVLTPTSGALRTRGRVCALLELGSGFNAEFSGRENVYLNGALLGLSKRELDEKFDEIADFADIGMFLDQPVKTYSSGMYVRLAFAVQACLDPDVLIIDEALAVGDIFFQQKCHAHIEKLMKGGTAVILVTHDMGSVLKYCTTAILLEEGNVRYQGDVQVATRIYYNQLTNKQTVTRVPSASPAETIPKTTSQTIPTPLREHWPESLAFTPLSPNHKIIVDEENAVYLVDFAVCDDSGNPKTIFEQGEVAHFYWQYELQRNTKSVTSALSLVTQNNIPLYCKNFIQTDNRVSSDMSKGSKLFYHQAIKLNIAIGLYTFDFLFAELLSLTPASDLTMLAEHDWIGLPTAINYCVCQVGTIEVVAPQSGLKIRFHALTDLCVAANSYNS